MTIVFVVTATKFAHAVGGLEIGVNSVAPPIPTSRNVATVNSAVETIRLINGMGCGGFTGGPSAGKLGAAYGLSTGSAMP